MIFKPFYNTKYLTCKKWKISAVFLSPDIVGTIFCFIYALHQNILKPSVVIYFMQSLHINKNLFLLSLWKISSFSVICHFVTRIYYQIFSFSCYENSSFSVACVIYLPSQLHAHVNMSNQIYPFSRYEKELSISSHLSCIASRSPLRH